MFRWLLNLLGLENGHNSKEVAHNRLRLVLISDRIGMAPDTLEAMKNDLLAVICRYLDISPTAVEVEVKQTEDSVVLVSNIRVQGLKRAGTAQ